MHLPRQVLAGILGALEDGELYAKPCVIRLEGSRHQSPQSKGGRGMLMKDEKCNPHLACTHMAFLHIVNFETLLSGQVWEKSMA